MKNLKYKVIISLIVFILAGAITIMLTRTADELLPGRQNMSAATLPTVCAVSDNGIKYNLMHGYITNLDFSSVHGNITPLPNDRELDIFINNYGQDISQIGFEVRSLDGTEFIEDSVVVGFDKKDDGIYATLNIKNLLENDEQYMLKIKLSLADGKVASYYTRIVCSEDLKVDEKLGYVLWFSECVYDQEKINDIVPKLETNSSGDNTNLGYVNIHSKLSQIGWAGLNPSVSTPVMPYLVETEGNTADIRLEYQVTTPAAGGLDLYNVKEYFRIRLVDAQTTYVLNYDRYVDQIFDGKGDLNDSGRIYIGIDSGLEDYKLTSDSSGKVTCFVRNGELWSYDSKKNRFVRVFSFDDDTTKYDSIRENYAEHGYNVISVDSDGDVSFVVYGYFNRGVHEGEMGIALCKYFADDNEVKEIIYIPRNETFEIIQRDVDTLAYLNGDNRFFIYVNDYIYSIDTTTKEYMVVSDNVINSSCVYSKNDKLFAFQEGDNTYTCNTVRILRLDSGELGDIEAGPEKYIRILGSIDGNLIYGTSFAFEMQTGDNGVSMAPFYRLDIVDGNLEPVKEYMFSGVRIYDVIPDDAKVIIKRKKYSDEGVLTDMPDDQLLSKVVASGEVLGTRQVATELRQKETYIILTVSVSSSGKTTLVKPKSITSDTAAIIYTKEDNVRYNYYKAYGMGLFVSMSEKVADAVKVADEWAGVVVGPDGKTVWNRYKPTSGGASVSNGFILGDKMDLTGCTLDEALYFVGKKQVLAVKIADNEYVFAYSYDKNNVQVYNESTDSYITYSKTELTTLMSQNDGIVFAYEVERK